MRMKCRKKKREEGATEVFISRGRLFVFPSDRWGDVKTEAVFGK